MDFEPIDGAPEWFRRALAVPFADEFVELGDVASDEDAVVAVAGITAGEGLTDSR